jgi:hypothetical protein
MRNLTLAALPFLVLGACNGEKEPEETGQDTADAEFFGSLINATLPILTEDGDADDLSCWTAGDAWVTETPAAECQIDATVSGVVRDFETDDPVDEATVEIFLGDTVTEGAAADQSATTDSSGNITFPDPIPTCSPFTYRATTDPARDETIITIDAHQVLPPVATQDGEFQSVSTATYAIIPSLLGVSVDDTKGAAAGTAYDCNGDPIEGAQVIVRDADGNYPDSQVVRYFESDFPVRNRTTTSADGLWVVLNVPEGRGNVVELYGVLEAEGTPVLLATSPVDVFADSLNISSTSFGYGDGVVYPAACLSAACTTDR